MPDLKERRDTLIKECRAIAEKAKAEGRDFLTEDERKTIDERLTEVKSINQTLIGAAESKNIFDQLDAMARHESSRTARQRTPTGLQREDGSPTQWPRCSQTASARKRWRPQEVSS